MNQIEPVNEDDQINLNKQSSRQQFEQDIEETINDRLETLIHNDGYQIKLTNPQLNMITSLIYLILLIGYSGLLVYDSIIGWQEFDQSDQYINEECPWGVIYILITLPTVTIQGPGYSTFNPKQKELQKLIYQSNIENNRLRNKILDYQQKLVEFYLGCILLLIQYFTRTFWDAILNIVALEFLSSIGRNLQSQIYMQFYNYRLLKKFWRTQKPMPFYEYNFHSIYYFFWEIKTLTNSKYIQFENQQLFKNNETIVDDLYKKIHDLYADLEHEPGFQVQLLFPSGLIGLRLFWLIVACGYIAGSILSKIYADDTQNQYFGDTNIPMGAIFIIISLPMILIQGPGYSIYNYTERTFFSLIKDYQYLCTENHQQPKDFLFPFDRIKNYYYYRNFLKVFLTLSLIAMQYFSQTFTEAILNLCALEFIGNLETNALQNVFLNSNRLDHFKYKVNVNFWALPYNTVIQLYNYIWKLDINPQELKDTQYENEQIAELIYKKLENLFDEIFHEEGFQYSLLDIAGSFPFRYFWLFTQIAYLAAMMISNINSWIYLSDSAKWIDGSSCPWGVIYIIITLPIIFVQGIGKSEKSSIEECYQVLRSDYVILKKQLSGPVHFEWNDQDLTIINGFNFFQEIILIGCLITIQFFAVDFYSAVLNIMALEFMQNLDEHALGNVFRNATNYKDIQKNDEWKMYKIWNFKEYSPESIFRYLWQIKSKQKEQ